MNPTTPEIRKHESTTQPGLFFWAERVAVRRESMFAVMAQAHDGPKHEAHDDWFALFADADAIAGQLARDEAIS